MTLQGRSDNDDSKKVSLQKAQESGFGQKGVAGRPKRDATELFNERIEAGRLDTIVDKVFTAWERGLDSDNDKLAADTATKIAKTLYNPEKKVVIEGPDQNQIHLNILQQHDHLNPVEQQALMMFHGFLKKGVEELEGNTIEGEVVDVSEVEDAGEPS